MRWGCAHRVLRVGRAQVLRGNRRKHRGEHRKGGEEEAHRKTLGRFGALRRSPQLSQCHSVGHWWLSPCRLSVHWRFYWRGELHSAPSRKELP